MLIIYLDTLEMNKQTSKLSKRDMKKKGGMIIYISGKRRKRFSLRSMLYINFDTYMLFKFENPNLNFCMKLSSVCTVNMRISCSATRTIGRNVFSKSMERKMC